MKYAFQYQFRAHNSDRIDNQFCTIETAVATFTRRIENAVESNLRATHELWINTGRTGWLLIQQRES